MHVIYKMPKLNIPDIPELAGLKQVVNKLRGWHSKTDVIIETPLFNIKISDSGKIVLLNGDKAYILSKTLVDVFNRTPESDTKCFVKYILVPYIIDNCYNPRGHNKITYDMHAWLLEYNEW